MIEKIHDLWGAFEYRKWIGSVIENLPMIMDIEVDFIFVDFLKKFFLKEKKESFIPWYDWQQ